jgi:anti-sigma factor (TIGR02949 family)
MTKKIQVSCDTLLSQISSYLDGELPESACAAIEQHAASCDRCGAVINDFRTTTGLCRTAATAPLPEEVRARARARVRELLGRK